MNLVHGNPGEPRAKLRWVTQATELLERVNECILHNVLRIRRIAQQAGAGSEQSHCVPPIERFFSPVVTVQRPADQSRVFELLGSANRTHPGGHARGATLGPKCTIGHSDADRGDHEAAEMAHQIVREGVSSSDSSWDPRNAGK